MFSQYIFTLKKLLENYGIDADTLKTELGLSSEHNKETTGFTAQHFAQCCYKAVEITGDLSLGLKIGAKLDITTHGALSHAFMSCSHFKEALKLLIYYSPLLVPDLKLNLQQSNETWVLSCLTIGKDRVRDRFKQDCFFASVSISGQSLLKRKFPCKRIRFNFPEPSYAPVYEEIFSFPVEFNNIITELEFDREVLDWPLSMPHSLQHNVRPQELLQITQDVTRLLVLKNGQFPGIQQVASSLFMSERSLRRRLEEKDTSFRKLMEQARGKLAKDYLLNSPMPISEISALLGYDNAANFRKAFKRWYGATPSEFRVASVQR